WSLIRELKKASPVPVIGSGDIFEPADALTMFRETGCDAVMIGRGAMGNPWIFTRVKKLMAGLPDPGGPGVEERFRQAVEHADMMVRESGGEEKRALIMMRKHFACYTRGLADASILRQELFSCLSLEQVKIIFNHYLERYKCTLKG
ncbi:MAG: tRNA-dihydrouridine synthase, partial [Gemmatimonadota bacterium]|nr:tRNA-dihydrouridine synthase [Gemmatimonadota bacterium]